jgi:isocitrate dehydrogenase
MLNHIGQTEVGEKIQNAWLKTLEEGIHTPDIYKEGSSKKKVGTREFAEEVISNLGQKPSILKAVSSASTYTMVLPQYKRKAPAQKELVGVDLFVHWTGSDPNELAGIIRQIATEEVGLTMITNRGIKVWPEGFKETFCTDHWRCRFKSPDVTAISRDQIIKLLKKALELKIDVIKTENLYKFDGVPAFSLGQGQ